MDFEAVLSLRAPRLRYQDSIRPVLSLTLELAASVLIEQRVKAFFFFRIYDAHSLPRLQFEATLAAVDTSFRHHIHHCVSMPHIKHIKIKSSCSKELVEDG